MKKIKTVQKILKQDEMILIDSSFDVLQLIEFDLSFNANEYDMNLLIGKNKIYLICESLFIPYAANTDNMIILKADYEKYLINNKTFINEIRNILHKHKIKKIGLVNAVLKRYFKDIETFGFISPLKTLGIVKSAQDIKLYRMCALMIKKVLSNIEDLMVQGMSDVELRNVIDINLYNAGAQRRYVPTLTGFNAKTVYPTLNGTLLKNGDMVLIDFGVMKEGAGLSVSKTFIYGKASKTKIKHMGIVNDGLEVMKSVIREGAVISDIDRAYRDFIKHHHLNKYFSDYTVKLPGTSFFEELNSIKDNTRLYAGSLVKLSSSLFIPGKYGIRHECIVLVKKRGFDELV